MPLLKWLILTEWSQLQRSIPQWHKATAPYSKLIVSEPSQIIRPLTLKFILWHLCCILFRQCNAHRGEMWPKRAVKLELNQRPNAVRPLLQTISIWFLLPTLQLQSFLKANKIRLLYENRHLFQICCNQSGILLNQLIFTSTSHISLTAKKHHALHLTVKLFSCCCCFYDLCVRMCVCFFQLGILRFSACSIWNGVHSSPAF